MAKEPPINIEASLQVSSKWEALSGLMGFMGHELHPGPPGPVRPFNMAYWFTSHEGLLVGGSLGSPSSQSCQEQKKRASVATR